VVEKVRESVEIDQVSMVASVSTFPFAKPPHATPVRPLNAPLEPLSVQALTE